ncbi:alanyl-tRNA editing protein [Candidatus Woesearchaeota archaeon]|nr:alanyl-tRNA editing protein [Candidatus Woesearchaeota archaeon]
MNRTHTALHVLKGAVQKTLGAEWTAGVFVEGNHGRLTVQFDRKPTDAEMNEIETLANNKIKEDTPVEIIEMERKGADEKFGNIIYDLFPLPSHITQLRICNIPDWNINCCNKEHCKTTGEIGQIRLDKPRFRENKKLLELPFDVI